jgi:hypothetical protein
MTNLPVESIADTGLTAGGHLDFAALQLKSKPVPSFGHFPLFQPGQPSAVLQ